MPQREDTPFQGYKLTVEELSTARALGTEQRAYYQSLMADAATEKINLMFDPYKPKLFVQAEAYLRGQIDILNMLLSDEGITRPKQVVPPDSKPNNP